MLKRSVPKSQVHSTRSSLQPHPHRYSQTEAYPRNVPSGIWLFLASTQPRRTKSTPNAQTPATFLFLPIHLSKNREELSPSNLPPDDPNLTARTRQQNTAGTTSLQRRRR
jgi:hypothetical protein